MKSALKTKGSSAVTASAASVATADVPVDPAVQAWLDAQLASVKAMLAERDQKLAERDNELRNERLKTQSLVMELARLRRLRFGASSEAMSQANYALFDETAGADIAAIEAQIQANAQALAQQQQSVAPLVPLVPLAPAVPKRRNAGRQTLPAHLPRVEHRHDLPAGAGAGAGSGSGSGSDSGARVCDCTTCGGLLTLIGEDVSEQLDVQPARFFVHRHIRPQYACKACETVVAAPVAPAVIDGALAAPGLLSWVLTSKFADHLPLYRLEIIALREGVELSRSTLSAWVGRVGFALQPLTNRLRELLKQRSVLHADETPVEQLQPGRGKTKRAYLWAYCSGELLAPERARERPPDGMTDRLRDRPPDGSTPTESANTEHAPTAHAPIVVFDYQSSRCGAHARAFLQGWSGHLMCDDFVGYKALFDGSAVSANGLISSTDPSSSVGSNRSIASITELGCMAHARRKFFDLHAAGGKQPSPIAAEALRRIGELYAIERQAGEQQLDCAKRQAFRHMHATPKLTQMKAWLVHTRTTTANGGALAKAIAYSLRRWEALSRYAQTGYLPIDNNAIENAIRPIALGKKNWLFAGSETGGQRAAAIQSLFATAKRNHLDPQRWLTDVIEKLPTWPHRRIDELLPIEGYRFGR